MVQSFAPLRRGVALLALTAASFLGSSPAQAALYTLEDTGLNSSLVLDTSVGNAVDWFVEGVDQLYLRQYFFRLAGSDSELAVNDANLNLISVNTLDTNFDPGIDNVSFRFLDPNQRFQITTSTTLTAGLPGSNQATFTESLRVDNLSRLSPLSISIILYADYDLNDNGSDGGVSFGDLRSVTQTDSSLGVLHEASVTVTPAVVETSFYPTLIDSLQDLSVTTLNGVTSVGPGDNVYALQWNLVIPAGRSWTLGNTNSITVPEASTSLLVGLGVVGGAWVARRRRGC
jgi:hypothetical protein